MLRYSEKFFRCAILFAFSPIKKEWSQTVMSGPLLIYICSVSTSKLVLILDGFKDKSFQFFGKFWVVQNALLGSIASLPQFGVVVAIP